MENNRTLKYPIVLVHGMGVRDRTVFNSFGRIPKKLRENGFSVFQCGQDANGSIVDNANYIKNAILQFIDTEKCEKVNIIAHSKGGLDVRYMISMLGMGDKIASLTTISTPHYGSKTIDFFMKIPQPLFKLGCKITDFFMKIGGDKNPKTYECIEAFRTDKADAFNKLIINDENVYYQSYGFIMKHWYSDIFMSIPYLVVYAIDGKNDGLVASYSSKWGEFQKLYTGNSKRGISHCDEVDMRRSRFTGKSGDNISDICDFYISIAKDLINKGY